MNARTPSDFLEVDVLAELERLSAADLVMKMRDVDRHAREFSDAERARLAEAFERTGKQFEAAARRLRRARPDLDIPDFIADGSTVDLNECRRSKHR